MFKLDWIFVKPQALTSPYVRTSLTFSRRNFGRTLKELNHSIDDRISDHDPLIVDLPLNEPANNDRRRIASLGLERVISASVLI